MSEPAQPEGVSVSATGRATAAPDVLTLALATEAQARDIGSALEEASRAMSAILARLRESGVADRDLRTTGASLSTRTDDKGRVTWHVATQRLTARLRDLSAAGDLVSAVVAAGGSATRVHGLRFVVDDDAAVLRGARADAWAQARQIADEHAAQSGRSLARVLRVRERTSDVIPQPPMRLMAAGGATPAGMPVEGGEQEVTVTIEVEWAFSD